MADNIQEKIENKIIDLINSGAGGRLIIFKPEGAIKGADLVVKKRGEYISGHAEALSQNPIIKPQVFGAKKQKSEVEIFLYIRNKGEEADASKTPAEKNYYIIFVFFNVIKQDIDDNVRILKLDDKKEFLINKKDLPQFLLRAT